MEMHVSNKLRRKIYYPNFLLRLTLWKRFSDMRR